MRTNCKKTCGLCGLTLRQVLELSPAGALRQARKAAKRRGVRADGKDTG
jgi:hypothetical protein